jgi:hypothetical protein
MNIRQALRSIFPSDVDRLAYARTRSASQRH